MPWIPSPNATSCFSKSNKLFQQEMNQILKTKYENEKQQ